MDQLKTYSRDKQLLFIIVCKFGYRLCQSEPIDQACRLPIDSPEASADVTLDQLREVDLAVVTDLFEALDDQRKIFYMIAKTETIFAFTIKRSIWSNNT